MRSARTIPTRMIAESRHRRRLASMRVSSGVRTTSKAASGSSAALDPPVLAPMRRQAAAVGVHRVGLAWPITRRRSDRVAAANATTPSTTRAPMNATTPVALETNSDMSPSVAHTR